MRCSPAAGLADAVGSFARSAERLHPAVGEDWNDALIAAYGDLCDALEASGLVAGCPRTPGASE